MEDCIFCKIIKGDVPCTKVYEDGSVLSFLDINPINHGHSLVILKEHYETLLDVPDTLLKKLIIGVKKVAKAVFEGVKADGFNLGMNNYKVAGQLVPHAHIHIIPRFNNDGLRLWSGNPYEDKDIKKTAEKIKSLL